MSQSLIRNAREGLYDGMESLLLELGTDPSALLRRQSLPVDLFELPASPLPARESLELLGAAAEFSNCPDLALHLAQRQDAGFLGVLSVMLQSGASLGQAIREHIAYQHLHSRVTDWEFAPEGRFVHLRLRLRNEAERLSAGARRQLVDLSLARAMRLHTMLIGAQPRIARASFRYAAPAHSDMHRRVFRAPLEFAAMHNALCYPATELERRLAREDPRTHATLERLIAGIRVDKRTELPEQVRRVISRLLPTDHCSVESIAAHLDCDRRVLQRLLREHGTSYRQLLREVRFDLATDYLRNSDIDLGQLALLCGFADLSAFSRAFKNERGISPQSWRLGRRKTKHR